MDNTKRKRQEKRRKKPRGRSVQELMGIRGFTRYGLATDYGELLLFRVSPVNISVLSASNIDVKIHTLQTALTVMPDLEIICTDSCECFDANKAYLRQREREESNACVRRLMSTIMSIVSCSTGSIPPCGLTMRPFGSSWIS